MDMEAKDMTDGERLVRVEENLKNVVQSMDKLNSNFENFTTVFVPRKEIDLMLQQRDEKIEELKSELDDKANGTEVERIVKEKDNWQKNLPSWAAVVIATIALITPFLNIN